MRREEEDGAGRELGYDEPRPLWTREREARRGEVERTRKSEHDPDPNFSTAGLENSCGKEGAVGAVKPGRKNREGGFLSYLPAGL